MSQSVIILRFSRDRSLISKIVRLATFSEYSHVDLYIPHLNVLVGSAPGHGVKFFPIPTEDECVYKGLIVDTETCNSVYADVMKEVGKEYDWGAVFGMPFRGNWQDPAKWYCAELIASKLLDHGVRVANKPSHRFTVQDLLQDPALVDFKVTVKNDGGSTG